VLRTPVDVGFSILKTGQLDADRALRTVQLSIQKRMSTARPPTGKDWEQVKQRLNIYDPDDNFSGSWTSCVLKSTDTPCCKSKRCKLKAVMILHAIQHSFSTALMHQECLWWQDELSKQSCSSTSPSNFLAKRIELLFGKVSEIAGLREEQDMHAHFFHHSSV